MSNEKINEEFEIDDKSKAVLNKKGYRLESKLGAGAFGLGTCLGRCPLKSPF